jgi:hypothetical protein
MLDRSRFKGLSGNRLWSVIVQGVFAWGRSSRGRVVRNACISEEACIESTSTVLKRGLRPPDLPLHRIRHAVEADGQQRRRRVDAHGDKRRAAQARIGFFASRTKRRTRLARADVALDPTAATKVKTGTSSLSGRERLVREAASARKVEWSESMVSRVKPCEKGGPRGKRGSARIRANDDRHATMALRSTDGCSSRSTRRIRLTACIRLQGPRSCRS